MSLTNKFRNKPYIILNLSFIGLILFIFFYSAIFSTKKDNHPIPSYYEELAGKESPTSGLSRSFSEIIRLNIKEAEVWNKNGLPIFLFFLVQLFMRIVISIMVFKKSLDIKTLVWADSITSVLLFIICFRNLLAFWKFF